MADTILPFITGADIKPFCPTVPNDTLERVAGTVDKLFCDLLPLRRAERSVGYMKHEVFWEEGWLSVETTLLNIISAKYEDKQLKIKPDGKLKSMLYFKEVDGMRFDPLLYLLITSGFISEELPGDLKEAMIGYAVDQALTMGKGLSSNISSYKMGERTVVFSENSSVGKKVLTVLKRYQSMF